MSAPSASRSPRKGDGEVACPGYLDDAESRALLAALPLEHLAYNAMRMSQGRLLPRLINRLRRERLRFKEHAAGTATLLLFAGAEEAAAAWTLQSYPHVAALHLAGEVSALRAACRPAAYVFVAGPGDLLHPSAAGIVMQDADRPEAVFWNRFTADAPRAGAPGTIFRRPCFDAATMRHGAVSDRTLALRGVVLAEAPETVLIALIDGRTHPLWFWLAGQNLRWRLHPEALTIGRRTPEFSRHDISRDQEYYAARLAEEGGHFTLKPTPDALPFPYVLTPTRRAAKVSVLIAFRDRADLTLACLQSIVGQKLSGALEVILVDNCSASDELARIESGARAMFGTERTKLIRYDKPFNHSAENNLAAAAADGEAIVICNNDITMTTPETLEHVAAWALQPGIGTVGCRIENIGRDGGCYGHIFAPPSDDPYRAPLQENDDPFYAGFIHAVPGNTLALAAIERERFLSLGGLDAERFPIGYNDVEFMLRCTRAGLTHLYLGHVSAGHRRGASRTGDNEDLQALLINRLYAAEIGLRTMQLQRHRVGGLERAEAAPPA